jgi:hypothetical protein
VSRRGPQSGGSTSALGLERGHEALLRSGCHGRNGDQVLIRADAMVFPRPGRAGGFSWSS